MARLVEFEFDPFELIGVDKEGLSPNTIKSVLDEVGDYVVEKVLKNTGNQISSVDGDKWDKLSPAYAKFKKKQGGTPIANLELTGDMLNSLRIFRSGQKLTLTVGANEQAKADGHNNHSGESKLPLRQFIPKDGETFEPKIMKGIESIVDDLTADERAQAQEQATTFEDIVMRGVKIALARNNGA